MAQPENTFTAFFLDTTTAPGAPLTSLSATITIVNIDNNTIPVNNQPMINLGGGFYKYVYNLFDPNINYAYYCNPNSALAFIESGVTQLPSGARGGSGLGGIREYTKGFDTKLEQMWKKLNEEKKVIEPKEVDLTPILDAISEIKMPEPTTFEEKEAKKVAKRLDSVEKLLKEYIESDNESKVDLGAIAEEFKQLVMDERKREEEEKKKEEEERKKREEDDRLFEEEFTMGLTEIEEKAKEDKRKELEQEIAEIEAERLRKEEELKSL